MKICNLESKQDSIVCTIKDCNEMEKHVPIPSENVVEYDKAASLCYLHEQIKQIEAEVEEAANSSSRRSKWQFMGKVCSIDPITKREMLYSLLLILYC